MTIAADMAAQATAVIASQGTDGLLGRAKAPEAQPEPVRFGLSHPSRRDEALVNSYGVDAQIVTIAATAELIAYPPEQFDWIEHVATGERFVFDNVVRREFAGVVIAFTGYQKGKAL